MEERLQKILSRCGVASRRKAEELIVQRRVRVNGNTASLGDTADEREDVIEVDGVRLKRQEENVYLLLNKPRGYVTTLSDEKGRKDVSQLVADCGVRVYPVGRLDLYSEGLLLLTKDGALANRLMHPKKGIEKVYLVWANGWADDKERELAEPIEIDGRMTRPAKVELLNVKEQMALLRITISEGRNRQIRRLCQRSGLTVTRLKRVQEGPVQLGELAPGKWRTLTEEELTALQKITCENA